VKIEWTPAARASARRYINDQDGMRAIGAAVTRLAENLYLPEAFHRGDYHRLRVGQYRVVYVVDDDALITIEPAAYPVPPSRELGSPRKPRAAESVATHEPLVWG